MTNSRANLEDSIKQFLAEDVGYGDITSNAIIAPQAKALMAVTCKEDAMIAGIEESLILLKQVNCKGTALVKDGQTVKHGSKILKATGPARQLLKIERTLLNLLSHMSGIATATAELVNIANRAGSKRKVRIAATRKTLPGLRFLEKRAVELAGGDPHRLGLDDAVLIKDNHLALTRSITDSIQKARSGTSFTRKIEVEVTSPRMSVEAARAGADIILLDNMTPEAIREAIRRLEKRRLRDRVMLEASGGIQRDNLPSYVRTGVDIISIGAITHSARAIDMSMELSPVRGKNK